MSASVNVIVILNVLVNVIGTVIIHLRDDDDQHEGT